MKSYGFLFFFALCATASSIPATVGEVGPKQLTKFYEVNLDLAPEDRWVAIGKEFKDVAGPILNKYLSQLIPKAAMPLVDLVGDGLDELLGDAGKELRGYAKALDVPVGPLAALYLGYELRPIGGGRPNTTAHFGACSSILAQQENGDIVHGRNLDWNVPDEDKQLVIQLNFTRGGETVFYATGFVGYINVLTGMKPNAFSVSINEREMGGKLIETIKQGILERSADVAAFARAVLETATSYDEAKLLLEGGKLLSPVYYILAGPEQNQGVVITRDRDGTRDVWSLAPPSQWYLVEVSALSSSLPVNELTALSQTNYDHWKTPYEHDNRRDPEIKMMNAVGQDNVNTAAVFKVLSSYPANNEHTTYTVMMSPALNTYESYIQYQGV